MALFRLIPAIALSFAACSLLAQGPQFTIQDLGTLSNLPACNGTALSQSGNVVGYCTASAGQNLLLNTPTTHGFLYSNGTLTDLNVTALSMPIPTGVNDSSAVVGGTLNLNILAKTASASSFVYQNGAVLPASGQLSSSFLFGLDNAGQSVGTSIQVSSSLKSLFIETGGFQYSLAGGAQTALTAPNGATAVSFGISPKGAFIAGAASGSKASAVSPVLWQNLNPQSLPLLASYPQGVATAINDSGAAAGIAFSLNFTVLIDPSAVAHAVVYNVGSVTDLGVLPGDSMSMASSINNSGTVVGFSGTAQPDATLHLAQYLYPPSGKYHAFIYSGGQMYNLTSQLVNGSGWQLSFATQINDAGQIVASGIFTDSNGNPEQHAVLLTPAVAGTGPSITAIEGAGFSTPPVSSISPNGIFTIFGKNLAAAPVGLSSSDIVNNQLPTNLGGTCVESGTSKWGLFYVSSGQINALAGAAPSAGPITNPLNTSVTVVTNCGTANEVISAVANVPETTVSPEFLYFPETSAVAAIEPSGAYIGPVGLIAGATFTPAKAGDVVTAFGVGWGPTTSSVPIGTIDMTTASLTSDYSLTLGGKPVQVAYAGLSPDYAGLYQINFTVPSGLSAGSQPLVLTVDGAPTSATAFIAVGN
jgi:uncharacterized protein (TIGR03437 family)